MSEKPIAYEAYQELAEHYAAHIDTKPHNAYLDRPAMLSMLPDIAGKRVLDAGCGPGAYTEALLERGAQVVGVDVSERMLELAVKRLSGRDDADGKVEFKRVDLTKPLVMFANESFDLVNAPLCLDYIEDWGSLFGEFRRILKPGGTLLFSVGHPSHDAEYFSTGKYHSIEAVDCVWTGFGIRLTMPSFRRSLEEVFRPILENGLLIDGVCEPKPTEDFKNADLKRYLRTLYRPCFLCVRAQRPVAATS